MKLFKSTWLVGSMAAAMLTLGAPVAVAGIAGSQHDFTAGGKAQGSVAAGTGSPVEICAFCHTPHASDIDAFVGAPLWNKSYSGVEADFTRYSALGTASLDGAEVNVGSVSLACLSCHDGSQAMDVVLNMPGQGMGTNTGTDNNNYDPNTSIGAMASNAGNTINAVALLGTDLRNDHPVSIEYAGGSSNPWPTIAQGGSDTWCDTDGECNDPDFKTVTGINKNGTPVWFFDGYDDGDGGTVATNGRVDKEEVRLYTRNSADGSDAYVECGSCHDPHNTKDNYGATTDNQNMADGTVETQVDFLRRSNQGSSICLSCHAK